MSQDFKDISFFDLKGNVLECLVAEHDSNNVPRCYQFDKNGKLSNYIYYDNIKRENGYIVEYSIKSVWNGTIYYKVSYNNGKKVKLSSDSELETYTYNSKGECIRKDFTKSGKIYTTTFTYLTYDSKGNWLKRERSINGIKTIEERMISYYGEPRRHIMGFFSEVSNELPSGVVVLKDVDLNITPGNGTQYFGTGTTKFYILNRFRLIDSDNNDSNYEWMEYLNCHVYERGDTSVIERGFLRALDKITANSEGRFTAIPLDESSLESYFPRSGTFTAKFGKEMTEILTSAMLADNNNGALLFERNYSFHDDIKKYMATMNFPYLMEDFKLSNKEVLQLDMIGDEKVIDLVVARKVTSNIYSVVLTLKSVTMPYSLDKTTLKKGDYKVFAIQNKDGRKRKSNHILFYAF